MIRKKFWFRHIAILLIYSFIFPLLAATTHAADRVYFYHTDPVGTPLSMTDSDGVVVWQAEDMPFGEEYGHAGYDARDKKSFVGKEKDAETGLHYFGARYHDSKIGRFISPDPVGAVDPFSSSTNGALLGNPQRLNYYAYSLNNPYKFVDKDGRFSTFAEGFGPDQSAIHAASQTPEVQAAGAVVMGVMGGMAAGVIGAASLVVKGVDPSTIRFTQKTVGNIINTPKGKRPLRKLVKDLIGGRVSADDLLPIRVFEKNGKLFSLDNRRLKAFQAAGKPVNTVQATADEVANEAWKFTSKNNGVSVKVRGGGL